MDLGTHAESDAFRERVRGFLRESLPADWRGLGALEGEEAKAFVREWRQVLAGAGFLAPAWPVAYGGGGFSRHEQVVLIEELAKAGVPMHGENDTFSIKMVGNVLLHFGTAEQREHFLPRILSGEHAWCQGFSEPDAGSDLASLRTTARLAEGRWVINGQKVWTSAAGGANWIFLLARTSSELSRHRGLSALLVPLDQPGIEIRPISMMSGESDFNEVHFSAAYTDQANVVGEINGGWKVAQGLLTHERGEEAATNPIYFRAEFDRLLEMARENGSVKDPVIRQRLAHCYSCVEIMRHLGNRTLTKWLAGQEAGIDPSVSKLYWSEYHQRVTNLAMDVMGLTATAPQGRMPLRTYRTDDPGAPNSSASWSTTFLNSRAGTIYAGSSQVQLNIIAETGLGLPREVRIGDRIEPEASRGEGQLTEDPNA